MEDKNYKAIIEAILFTMGDSVELEKIANAIELDKKETKRLLDEMKEELNQSQRGVDIIELDGSYQMCTKQEMYEYLIKIAKQPTKRQLTDVLLETLSIIAYKQPVTKSEIEKIRGVSCDHAVNKLVEYNWFVNSADWMHLGVRCFLARRKNSCAVLAFIPLMNFRFCLQIRLRNSKLRQKRR